MSYHFLSPIATFVSGFEEIQLEDVEQGYKTASGVSLPTGNEKEALVEKLRREYPMVDATMVEIITETVTYDESKARMLLNTQQRREEQQQYRLSTAAMSPTTAANLFATSPGVRDSVGLTEAEAQAVSNFHGYTGATDKNGAIVAMPVFVAGAPQDRRISLHLDSYPAKNETSFTAKQVTKQTVTKKPSNQGDKDGKRF